MAQDRDARLDALLAEADIRACLTRFSRGMDRFDKPLYLSAFHPDATVAAGPFVGSAEACYDWAVPMHEAGQFATHHNLLNCTIDIAKENGREVAHAETYYLFVGRNRDDSNWMAGGRYLDRLERRDGAQGPEWRIVLRTNLIEWSGMAPSLPLPFADVPDIFRNGAPSRSPTDPSYQRPLTNRRAQRDPSAG
ncbi:nuclear transport factor 2 family protein [Novosphingobium sp.]|uniref:nuclear transport factor 2 family protein n=1 Tax=Novosphingobium sp. TaxID=1874826 RepID=UPI0025FD395E|nr:nuclear transport factor 2 family protein [Novosphingobium sp.]